MVMWVMASATSIKGSEPVAALTDRQVVLFWEF